MHNYENEVVDGVRDLLDFFPVEVNLKELLPLYPPEQYTYRLVTGGEHLNLVLTDLTPETVGYYLVGNNGDLGPATVLDHRISHQLITGGVDLLQFDDGQSFKNQILQDGKGVILLEGRSAFKGPLRLEVVQNGVTNFRAELNLSLAGVEQMFRQKNLIREMQNNSEYFSVLKALPPDNGEIDRLIVNGSPVGFTNPEHFLGFDETTSEQNFVLVHGYNVNAQEARGFQAEVFKRLFWSGMNAKFWAITWYGWESQIDVPIYGKRSPNYHINVRHAYNAGKMLKDFVAEQNMSAPTIAAHSLGNVVASTAIQKGMPYSSYISTAWILMGDWCSEG
jgi:hypothetical protein